MFTSIDDLLTTLDVESRRSGPKDPRDAALALETCARMLTRLRDDLPQTNQARARDDVIRRLADSCSEVAVTFERAAGRMSDLAGVLSDATCLPEAGINPEDRWAIAVRVATPARRLAAVIAASGPYGDVPQLLAVADRSRELLRTAATMPPQLGAHSGLDRPITSTLIRRGATPAAAIVEATAKLAAEFRRYGRDPMTVRELVATCHASSRVAAYAESFGLPDRTDKSITSAWQKARDAVAAYSDGIPVSRQVLTRSLTIDAALAVDYAVTYGTQPRELAPPMRGESEPVVRAQLGRLLNQIAIQLGRELERIRCRLFVSGGERPLSDDRVGEWLRHETFQARPPDLLAGVVAIRVAHFASNNLISEVAKEASYYGHPAPELHV